MHRELVDARGDEPVLHLVLPPIARVSVAVVDAATGASIERAGIGWSDGALAGVGHNSLAKVLRDAESGRFVFEAPYGSIEVEAEAPEYASMSRKLELTDSLELELKLEYATGVDLSFYDGEQRLPIAMDVEGLRVLDPDSGASMNGSVLNMRTTSQVSRLLLRPGRYELEFSDWPKGWEPTGPIVVEIPARGVVEVRVPVRKR
jgi:hypothetical protein